MSSHSIYMDSSILSISMATLLHLFNQPSQQFIHQSMSIRPISPLNSKQILSQTRDNILSIRRHRLFSETDDNTIIHQSSVPYNIYLLLYDLHGIITFSLGLLILAYEVGVGTAANSTRGQWISATPSNIQLIYISACSMYCMVDTYYTYYTSPTEHKPSQNRKLLHNLICAISMIYGVLMCSDLWIIHIGLMLGEITQPIRVIADITQQNRKPHKYNSNKPYTQLSPHNDMLIQSNTSNNYIITVCLSMRKSLYSMIIDNQLLMSICNHQLYLISLILIRFIALQYCTHVVIPKSTLLATRISSLAILLLNSFDVMYRVLNQTKQGRQLFKRWPF